VNILVTGASGFIGSHLVKAIAMKHHVVGLTRDLCTNPFVRDAHCNTTMVFGDASDPKLIGRILVDYEIDVVVHLAAQAIVKHAKDMPALTIENNIMAGLTVLECARLAKTGKVIIQSTDKVYGNGLGMDMDERLVATEAYGTSKACVDLIAQTYANIYDMNITITRPCNVYGYDWNNRIIPNTIRACMAGKRPVIFKNDQSMRQYVHINDLVDVFTALVVENYPGVVNIGGDEILGQEKVVRTICEHFTGIEPIYVEKPGLLEIVSQSIIPSTVGYCPTPFATGISKTIEEFKKWTI
jgi:nucleoside-diphosphate-sugar epimerase